jgi:hypothetical protein
MNVRFVCERKDETIDNGADNENKSQENNYRKYHINPRKSVTVT